MAWRAIRGRRLTVDQRRIEVIAEHADGGLVPSVALGSIWPLKLGRGGDHADDGAQRQVLTRRRRCPVTRVEIRRFVLEQVAEVLGSGETVGMAYLLAVSF